MKYQQINVVSLNRMGGDYLLEGLGSFYGLKTEFSHFLNVFVSWIIIIAHRTKRK